MVEQAVVLRAERLRVAELAPVRQPSEFVIRRGVPQEVRQAGGQGVVVEPSGRLGQADELGRAEHGGITGVHRVGERRSRGQFVLDDRQEPDLLGLGHWPAIDLADERPEQPLGVLLGPARRDGRRPVRTRLHGQVAEEQRVPGRRPPVVDRALGLHPAEGNPRATLAGGQRVVPVRRPGAEQPGRVEPDRLALEQPDLDLVDSRFGVHVEPAEGPRLPGRDLRPDDHRLDRPTLRGDGPVGNPPPRLLARPGPERVGRGTAACTGRPSGRGSG